MRPSLYRVSLCPISFSASQLLFCQFNFTRLTLSFIKFRQINICNINIINTIILSINIQYYSEVLDGAGGGGTFHCILGLEHVIALVMNIAINVSIVAIVQSTVAATVRFLATQHALCSLLSNCCLHGKNSVDVSLSSKTVYESRKMASLLMFGSSDKPASLIHSPVNIILHINNTFYCIHSVHFTFLLIFITKLG